MGIENLNLNEEQTKGVNDYVVEQVARTKEGYKDYISKKDLDKLVQTEIDKVKTEYEGKLDVATEELKKYKPRDKTPGEIELEKRLKILEDKEKEVARKEKVINISNKLKEQELPEQLAKYLSGIKDDKIEDEIGNLKEIFTSTKIDNSFKPGSHKSNTIANITKKEFRKMDYMDRLNLFNTNEDLYKKLSE